MSSLRSTVGVAPAVLAFLAILVHSTTAQSSRDPGERASERIAMVEDQIAARGVKDERVLDAMRTVPRHWFMPDRVAASAYTDRPLPIGHGQTISQPYIVAYMTEALEVKREHRVLEIGTGSGYQAAVLSGLVKQVFTIEIVPELGRRAAAVLKEARYRNVTVKVGDGYQGWPEQAPFDRIIVTAAPDHVPQPLIDQLAMNGRMIIPVGPVGGVQELIVVTKTDKGVVQRKTIPVLFVPLIRGQIRENDILQSQTPAQGLENGQAMQNVVFTDLTPTSAWRRSAMRSSTSSTPTE
jgi:protein-L-isoaspartate(D-aspartate) O-methyltransferase